MEKEDQHFKLVSPGLDGESYVHLSNELIPLLHFILAQAKKLVSAKHGAIYFHKPEGRLKRIGKLENPEIANQLAKFSVKKRKNLLVHKGKTVKAPDLVAKDSYICCNLGYSLGNFNLGSLVLEGIEHFDDFSEEDVQLIVYFCSNLTSIFTEAVQSSNAKDFYTGISNAVLLLVDNSNIHNKNKRLEYFLAEVIRVSILINSSLDIGTLMQMIMESAKSVFRSEASSLLLLDEKKEYLVFHTVTGEKKEEVAKIKVPMGQGIAGTVAVTKKPMIINDAQTDPRVFRDVDKASQFVTRNILAAPLIAGDEVIGVIEAINTIDRNNFSANDIEFFLTFSSACAVAIQKTGLLENLNKANLELKGKVSTLESLFQLGQAVLVSHDESTLLDKSLSILSEELKADKAGMVILANVLRKPLRVFLRSGSETEEHFFEKEEVPFLWEGIQGLKISSDGKDILPANASSREKEIFPGSFLFLPISSTGSTLQAGLFVSRNANTEPFTETDFRMLKTISSPLSKAYENLRLNQEMITKKSIEKEIEITRNIQNNILPNNQLVSNDFEVGVKTVAAKEVSGDFYDFHSYGNHRHSFLIADVSGKSLPAAIFMAMSSSIIRTLSRTTQLSPSELLKEANKLIYEDSQSGMFVTLFYLSYDSLRHVMRFASAGHNDQILIKKDGSYELLKGKGAPLGVVPLGNYFGGELEIAAGDILVLYTDGAIEEKDRLDEEFGLERFVQEITIRREKNAQEIIEEVYEIIRDFSDFQDQYDDFTVMILKFPDNMESSINKKFEAQFSQVPKVRNFVSEVLENRVTAEFALEDILVCVDEATTNIVMHGYAGSNHPSPYFEIVLSIKGDVLIIHLIDEAKPFVREIVPEPSIESNMKGERKGGFGVFLVEKLMDSVVYSFLEGKNHTIMEKKIR